MLVYSVFSKIKDLCLWWKNPIFNGCISLKPRMCQSPALSCSELWACRPYQSQSSFKNHGHSSAPSPASGPSVDWARLTPCELSVWSLSALPSSIGMELLSKSHSNSGFQIWGTSRLFSKVATPVYAPLAVYEGSSFLTSSPASVIFGSLFGDSHSDRFFKFPKDCKSNFFKKQGK